MENLTFETPDFLKNTSTDKIHARMLEALPADIDTSFGNHEWNMTRPTAIETAEMLGFYLPEAIKLIFPMFSYGSYLDLHGKSRNIKRKEATKSSGYLSITVKSACTIPSGSVFSTASVDGYPSIDFVTTETVKATESEAVKVAAECTQAGVVGNVGGNTITMKATKIDAITSVTNEESFDGGTETETDDSLMQRILDYDRGLGVSYVGSIADYKRWAKEVAGVGEAIVVSAEDDSGTVTIILTDSNGEPANENLRKSVYNHIMKPDEPDNRLSPANAFLSVVAPESVEITVSAKIELEAGVTIETVKTSFLRSFISYLQVAPNDKEVRYTKLLSLLSSTPGVYDYSDVLLNGETANIPITKIQLPTISDENVTFTESIVS